MLGGVAGFGAAGVVAGATGARVPLTTEPGPRCPRMLSVSAHTMNKAAAIAVAFDSTVAPVRAPKAA